MGRWDNLLGTVSGYLRLGLSGPRLNNSSGALAVRNAGDSADAAVTVAGITASGDATFTGNSRRFQGDWTNATPLYRMAFQTSTVDGATYLTVLPNGTGTVSGAHFYNASDPTNATRCQFYVSGTTCYLIADKTGTGTYGDLVVYVNNAEVSRYRAADGNVSFRNSLVFEGTTDDAYETTLGVVDPTADRAINLPNASGTVLLDGDIGATVQVYDADTAKLDVAQTWTANQRVNADIGINIDPTRRLHIYSATEARGLSVGEGCFAGWDANRYSTDALGSQNLFSKYRGTIASPTAVSSFDSIGDITGRAYDGGELRTCAYARLAVETYTASNDISGYFSIFTRPTGVGGAIAERFRVNGTGDMGVGTTSPSCKLHVNGPIRCGSYTVATVPSASTVGAGTQIYVSNEAGGATMAFSDGTNWRRDADRAIIS